MRLLRAPRKEKKNLISIILGRDEKCIHFHVRNLRVWESGFPMRPCRGHSNYSWNASFQTLGRTWDFSWLSCWWWCWEPGNPSFRRLRNVLGRCSFRMVVHARHPSPQNGSATGDIIGCNLGSAQAGLWLAKTEELKPRTQHSSGTL